MYAGLPPHAACRQPPRAAAAVTAPCTKTSGDTDTDTDDTIIF
jgi:hypothetical protein